MTDVGLLTEGEMWNSEVSRNRFVSEAYRLEYIKDRLSRRSIAVDIEFATTITLPNTDALMMSESHCP